MLLSIWASLFAASVVLASPACKLQARANKPVPEASVSRFLAPKPRWAVYSLSDYSSKSISSPSTLYSSHSPQIGTQALPQSQELTGYNVIIASFWLSTNTPAYKLQEFTSLSASTRQWILNDYHSRNISFLVSAFGDGDNPTSENKSPVTVVDNLAAFVKQYQFDGVDIDWEDFNSLLAGPNVQSGKAEQWLIDFTTELRKQLPQGRECLVILWVRTI